MVMFVEVSVQMVSAVSVVIVTESMRGSSLG